MRGDLPLLFDIGIHARASGELSHRVPTRLPPRPRMMTSASGSLALALGKPAYDVNSQFLLIHVEKREGKKEGPDHLPALDIVGYLGQLAASAGRKQAHDSSSSWYLTGTHASFGKRTHRRTEFLFKRCQLGLPSWSIRQNTWHGIVAVLAWSTTGCAQASSRGCPR